MLFDIVTTLKNVVNVDTNEKYTTIWFSDGTVITLKNEHIHLGDIKGKTKRPKPKPMPVSSMWKGD